MNTLEKFRENEEDKKYHQQKNQQKFVPMLMSTPMVYAIENGTKTETRRIVKYNKEINDPKIGFSMFTNPNQFEVRGIHKNGEYGSSFFKLKIKKGDIIWVRETWAEAGNFASDFIDNSEVLAYKTQEAFLLENKEKLDTSYWNWDKIKWKPSIFMPKQACRIFLEVANVKIQRLQDITEQEAINEGIVRYGDHFEDYIDRNMYLDNAITSFKTLWQSINGTESWDQNPFVFVYQFKKVEKPVNFI